MSSLDTETNTVISREEAVKFLVENLKIHNASELLSQNKHELLDKFMRAWLENIPFQSVKQKVFKTAVRSPSDVLSDVISGEGGLCGTHVVAAYHILRAVGYDCYMALGSVQSELLNHVVLFVNNVDNDGDLFLCPVGVGYPAFKAIQVQSKDGFVADTGPLVASVCHFRYIQNGDFYIRYHVVENGKDNLGRPFTEIIELDGKSWGALYKVDIAPRSYEDICSNLNESIYCVPDSKFNTMAMAKKYPAGRLLYANPKLGIVENENGELVKTMFENLEDQKEFMIKHFPEIPSEFTEKACSQ